MSYQLFQGDCKELIRENKIVRADIVVTDPPYLNKEKPVKIRASKKALGVRSVVDSLTNPWGFDMEWVDSVATIQPRQWVVFCNYQSIGETCMALKKYAHISCIFTWLKRNSPNMSCPVPRMDCEFIVWARSKDATCGRMREFGSQVIDIPNLATGCCANKERILIPGTKKAAHPCQKPLALITPFIERLAEEGDIVFDPFMGTGTFGVAALQLGFNFIGVDLSGEYFQMAEQRIKSEVV
jgi:DNA modification methylase